MTAPAPTGGTGVDLVCWRLACPGADTPARSPPDRSRLSASSAYLFAYLRPHDQPIGRPST
ncbi:hypothetical protein FAIPA1_450007 [Frankia sp. AiPs1]